MRLCETNFVFFRELFANAKEGAVFLFMDSSKRLWKTIIDIAIEAAGTTTTTATTATITTTMSATTETATTATTKPFTFVHGQTRSNICRNALYLIKTSKTAAESQPKIDRNIEEKKMAELQKRVQRLKVRQLRREQKTAAAIEQTKEKKLHDTSTAVACDNVKDDDVTDE